MDSVNRVPPAVKAEHPENSNIGTDGNKISVAATGLFSFLFVFFFFCSAVFHHRRPAKDHRGLNSRPQMSTCRLCRSTTGSGCLRLPYLFHYYFVSVFFFSCRYE